MQTKRICAAILASGSSKRFGEGSKLLQHFNGLPIIDLVINSILRVNEITEVIAIVRSDDHNLRALLSTRDVRVIQNSNYQEGISASIRTAVKEAKDFDGLLICPADMPWLTSASIERLCLAWKAAGSSGIAAAIADGQLRSPAVFGSDWFPKLLECMGDNGAKWILDSNSASVDPIVIPCQELEDIDLRKELQGS